MSSERTGSAVSTGLVERTEGQADDHRTGSVRPSLLRAETRRFASRRFIRVLLLLAAVGYAAVLLIGFTQYSRTTPEVMADAQRKVDTMFAQNEQFRGQCLADPTRPKGVTAEEFCGPPMTAENFGEARHFVDSQPFDLAVDGLNGAQGMAFATAALAFLIGATFIGAEWSGRSLVALLFWEPRRTRVMAAKLAVLTGSAVLLAALVQGAWLAGARLLATNRGSTDVPAGFWGDYLGTAGRGVFVAVVAALLGFGLANAVRHTAAALGIGFLYFAVVESMVRAFRPSWQPWLFTDNAFAFIQNEPYTVYVNGTFVDDRGFTQYGSHETVISHLHAGLVLGLVSLAVVAVGVLLFKRRDLN